MQMALANVPSQDETQHDSEAMFDLIKEQAQTINSLKKAVENLENSIENLDEKVANLQAEKSTVVKRKRFVRFTFIQKCFIYLSIR